ncbi:MAG: metal-dependent hydrolase [Chlorobiaceae bacterium]|nr:metal-dependent hydrolase [Chlorobiaceae bacterium]
MIFGHLPAGYITSKLLIKRFEHRSVSSDGFNFLGMLGAIAPDFDLLYAYNIDEFQHNHHTFLTHLPVFWLTLFLISFLWLNLSDKHSQNPAYAFIFSLGGLTHMVLDTFTGAIYWLEPFSNTPFSLTSYDLEYTTLGLSYFAHWAFVLELAIIWWALFLRFKKS